MIMILAFAIYFCILTSIGVYFYQRNKNASDYIIGNRSLNYWVTAIATQASDMGSWLFLAFPAAIFTNGLFEFWTAIGLIIFMFLNWQFIAPRLRYETERYNALTLSTFFSNRFNDTSGILRVVSALITILFFTFYITSGIVGLGKLFQAAFSIDYNIGIILGLICGITYTLIGGFLAVAWCDMFQGIFLLVMILFVPIYSYFIVGGIHAIKLAASTKNISLSLFSSETSLLTAFALAAGWGLGYFGQPHILTNFMGIDDPKKISRAKWVGITWQILVLSASAMIGVIGLAYFNQGLENPELLFVLMTKQLFFPLLAGFVLCAILAATLSTLDSHILVSGSTFAEDLYQQLFRKNATSIELMWISRAASLSISLIALYIASNNNHSVYNLVNYAWSGIGSAFGPLVITSLYGKNITREGAIAGMLIGSAVAGIWPYYNFGVLPLIPGFFSGLLTIYIISFFTRR
jgi:sodium/proline symporter